MDGLHDASASDARSHLTDLLEAAEVGRAATVERGSERAAFVSADRFRHLLATRTSARVDVAFDGVSGRRFCRAFRCTPCRTPWTAPSTS